MLVGDQCGMHAVVAVAAVLVVVVVELVGCLVEVENLEDQTASEGVLHIYQMEVVARKISLAAVVIEACGNLAAAAVC